MRLRRPFIVQAVNDAANCSGSEDVCGWKYTLGGLHIWVIDGATSIAADPCHMSATDTDPAWFAGSFSAELRRSARFNPITSIDIERILRTLRVRWSAGGGKNVPVCDWPIAAMAYIFVCKTGGGYRLTTLRYADCTYAIHNVPTWIRAPARVKVIYPSRAREPRAPFAGLDATVVDHLRIRREQQIIENVSSALTLNPQSAFTGARAVLHSNPRRFGFCASDGFERLWSRYKVRSVNEVIRNLAFKRMDAEFLRLRAHERDRKVAYADKKCDDACAVSFYLP